MLLRKIWRKRKGKTTSNVRRVLFEVRTLLIKILYCAKQSLGFGTLFFIVQKIRVS